MSDTTAGLLQVGLLIAALAACYRPLGRLHGPRLHQRPRHPRGAGHLPGRWAWTPRPTSAGRSTPVRCSPSPPCRVLGLYALQRFQPHLPLSLGFPGVAPDQAFNTAASFVTNTNWQSYSGESTMGHLVQMAGLAVQNFVSAAVGMAVAVALIRGFVRSRTDRLGNFWVDLVRGSLRILLPIAVVGTVVLVALGAVQNFSAGTDGHHPGRAVADHHRRPGRLPGGHQGAGHQRRRLLQRQLRAPVREPQRPVQPARDLPAAAHPGLPDLHVRPDGQGQAAGLRDPRPRWASLWALIVVGISVLEAAHPGTALQPGRRVDGGQGDPLRVRPPPRCSRPRPPGRPPGRSTRSTPRSPPSAAGWPSSTWGWVRSRPAGSAPGSTGCSCWPS